MPTKGTDTIRRKPTVVLADDHPATLRAITILLDPSFEVLATVDDGLRALQAAEIFRPDLIVLDIGMPGIDGFEAARRIRSKALPIRIVFLTIAEDLDFLKTASELGAGYIVKRRMHSDLLPAAADALTGHLFVSPFAPL